MNNFIRCAAILSIALLACESLAQSPDKPRDFGDRQDGPRGPRGPGQGEFGPSPQRGGPGGGRRGNPLMAVLDTDRDGSLSESEINNAPTALKSLDTNKDGVVEAEEIQPRRRGGQGDAGEQGQRRRGFRDEGRPGGEAGLGRLGALGGMDPAQMADRVFSRRDADGDGKLSGDEIPERMAAMLQRLDTNGDNAIERSEFEEMIGEMRNRRGEQGNGQGVRPRRPPVAEDE